jgi:hypothetical protein
MAAIILSAGIIGQIDAANEMDMKRQAVAEVARSDQADRQLQIPEVKTALARVERNW